MKILTIPSIALAGLIQSATAAAQTPLDIARYDAEGRMLYPADTVSWIHAGSVLGGQYSEEPFDPAHPGTIGVVQMEPSAYEYFMKNGDFIDGTMFLLTFYGSEAKSQPQLQGFVQGEVQLREIHVIDKARFNEGRAFFQFPGHEESLAVKTPDGSECVRCHTEEGSLDGVFVQFYPTLLDRR